MAIMSTLAAIGTTIASGAAAAGSAIAAGASAIGGASTIIPAALSIGGQLLASSGSNQAAQQAADAQTQAATQAANVQRQNFEDVLGLMRPRIAAGDTAIGQMMFELGLSESPGIPGITAPAGANGVDYSQQPQTAPPGASTSYGDQNPDVSSAFDTLSPTNRDYVISQGYDTNGDGILARSEYDQFHYQEHGQGEGRAAPSAAAGLAAQGGQEQQVQLPVAQVTGLAGQGQQVIDPNNPVGVADGGAGDVAGTGAVDDRFASFRDTPGYQFQLAEGGRALDASASARGRLLTGAQMKRMKEFGQGLANQTYSQYYDRLAGLANIGGQATGTVASVGTSTAGNLANIYQSAGDARASSYQTQGAINAGTIGSIGSTIGGLAGQYNYG